MKENPQRWQPDNWQHLKQFTSARVALGKAGHSLPTEVALKFRLDHAMAKDAVKQEIDFNQLIETIEAEKVIPLQSQAQSKPAYLQRPDLGRKLAPPSYAILEKEAKANDIALIVADGLSAMAVQNNAAPLLNLLVAQLHEYALAPVCLVKYGRVAIGDAIGEALQAKMSIVIIGERPGLSAADSLGIYTTFQPKTGNTDESRNCISNIRPGGLSFDDACYKIMYLIRESFRLQLSGVQLKENANLGRLI